MDAIPETNEMSSDKQDIKIDNKKYYEECRQHLMNPDCVSYLETKRGLPIDFCRENGVGYDEANSLVVIPHTDSFCTRRYIGNNPNQPRFSYQKGSHLELYNARILDNTPCAAVTESAFDALTLMYVGIPTVGLGGTSNWKKFVSRVKDLVKIPIILLALDNDESGRQTTKELEESLEQRGIYSYDVSKMICGDYKDANERHQNDSEGLKKIAEHLKSGLFGDYIRAQRDEREVLREAKIRKQEQVEKLFDFANTDDGNAARMLHLYESQIRYLSDFDKWLQFEEGIWKIALNSRSSVLYPLARKLSQKMLESAKTKDQIEQARIFESRKRRSDAIEMIKGYDRIIITSKDLNNHPMLLNCANGVIDLETGKLMERDSSLLFTLSTGAKYQRGYHSETFDKFMEEVLPEEQVRESLLMYLGYCLTGSVREDKALFIHGSGRNGKGTLITALLHCLGTFATPLKIESLLENRYEKDGDAPTPELAKLEWKRMAIADEIPHGKLLNAAKFKLLTGGDSIPVRRLHSEASVIENPTHKLILSGNTLPELRDSRDIALNERLLVIKFEQSFIGDKCDPKLREEIKKPQTLSGMLTVLVEKCMQWQKLGRLIEPPAAKTFKFEYLEANDSIGQFIAENCIKNANLSIGRNELLQRIRKSLSAFNMSDKSIIAAIKNIEGISYRRGSGGVYRIYGIGWIEGEQQGYMDSLTNEE